MPYIRLHECLFACASVCLGLVCSCVYEKEHRCRCKTTPSQFVHDGYSIPSLVSLLICLFLLLQFPLRVHLHCCYRCLHASILCVVARVSNMAFVYLCTSMNCCGSSQKIARSKKSELLSTVAPGSLLGTYSYACMRDLCSICMFCGHGIHG